MSSKPIKPSPASSPGVADRKLSSTKPKSKEVQSKMHHRRSRNGCFTCRLRRKKCDETRPVCKACRNLRVDCEYNKPGWWTNAQRRKDHKEFMKEIIKQTKLEEKPARAAETSTNSPPPSLCHSLPTSDTHSENIARTRGASPASTFSPQFDFNATPIMAPPNWTPIYPQTSTFSPYDVDIRTERQMFVNDIPTRKDSMTSTFSAFQPPLSQQLTPQLPAEGWVHREYYESHSETLNEEPVDFNFFDFSHEATATPSHSAVVQVDDEDKHLLEHFLDRVVQLIFPILDVNQHGSARSDVILPALESNKTYLHCCLSIAAVHLKTTEHIEGEQIDNDIMRHRVATITELCEAFRSNTNLLQILEATLGLIFFQSSVGSRNDGLPDIPWHQHFQAATDLLNTLDFQSPLHIDQRPQIQPPFNMTLASWIDILGATMLGRVPVFADAYRQKVESGVPSGLVELMGCEDRIMYVISEIACLESLRSQGMEDMVLCQHIANLGNALSNTETGPGETAMVYSATGAIRPKQLSKNITAIFRIAARIYLCSLVPDFERTQASIRALVDHLTAAMSFIPSGPEGFDRSLVWPLLIAGSISLEGSFFRAMFRERTAQLGDASDFGSFGRLKELLHDVWNINDAAMGKEEKKLVHWRDVMRQNGGDFLLI